MAFLTILILILLLLTSQGIILWLVLVGIRFSVSKFDINYGISMPLT